MNSITNNLGIPAHYIHEKNCHDITDTRLLEIVQKQGQKIRWPLVANDLNNGWTSHKCRCRWKKLQVEHRKWTPEICQRMAQLVQVQRGQLDWFEVSSALVAELNANVNAFECERYFKEHYRISTKRRMEPEFTTDNRPAKKAKYC